MPAPRRHVDLAAWRAFTQSSADNWSGAGAHNISHRGYAGTDNDLSVS